METVCEEIGQEGKEMELPPMDPDIQHMLNDLEALANTVDTKTKWYTHPPFTKAITSQLCKNFMNEYMRITRCPGDRPLKRKRIKAHKEIFSTENLRIFNWGLAFCKETGLWYRVNGQHSSEAMHELFMQKILKEGSGIACIEIYIVEDTKELARLMASIDGKASTRTSNESIGFYVENDPLLRDMRHPITGKKLASCVFSNICSALDMMDGQQYGKTVGERIDLLIEHIGEAKRIIKLICDPKCSVRSMKTPALISMLFKTIIYCKEHGYSIEDVWEKFWIRILHSGIGDLELNDPRVALANFLNSQKEMPKANADRIDWMSRTIRAWNYFVQGRTLSQSKACNSDTPNVLPEFKPVNLVKVSLLRR